jgi:hypothetical protein
MHFTLETVTEIAEEYLKQHGVVDLDRFCRDLITVKNDFNI